MATIVNLYRQALKDTFLRPKNVGDLEKPRIQFIDLAKGVCILLVCIYHTELGRDMPNILSLFRMPLYFVLSGLFFKDYGGFFNLSEKKINKILIPALFFYAISYPAYKLAEYYGLIEPKGGHFFSFFFSDIRYSRPIWFLFSLFSSNLIFCILYKMSKGKTLYVFLGSVLCSLVGYLFYKSDTRPVMYIDTALTMMPYFFLGWWLRKINILIPLRWDKVLFVLSTLIIIAIFLFRHQLDQYHILYIYNEFPQTGAVFSFVIGAVMVIATLFCLKSITWLPFISYLGRFSIIVLLIHSQLVAALRGVLTVKYEILTLIFAIIICWFSIPLIKYYLPYVCAQKDWFKLPSRQKQGIRD